jgi:hypothetical protein
MPIARFELPDGRIARYEVPEGTTPEQAQQMIAASLGGQMPSEPATPSIASQVLGFPGEVIKGFVRGISVDPASGLGSLAYTGARAAGAELKPFEETFAGEKLGQAQSYLAPDPGLINQFGGGVGSLLSFVPGALLKGGTKALTLGAQSMGVGSEEARARAEQAQLEGIEVSPEQQFGAQVGGTAIGLTELLPVQRLVDPIKAVLGGLNKTDAERLAPGIFNSAKRMLETGGIEGFQEGMANILQDLNAKGIYNPNLSVGESALGDAAMGASVGAFAQGAIELVTKGKRTQQYEALKAQERRSEAEKRMREIEEKYVAEIEKTKEQLGVQQTVLALPAPPEEIKPFAEIDPVLNPLGKFTQEEVGLDALDKINKARKKKGLPQLDELSIEDMADAKMPQGEIDRVLAFKTGYDGTVELAPEDVMNVAQSKNIDTETPGFKDFLLRTTGTDNLNKMSQPQLFSAFKAFDSLNASDTLNILPEGTNATRFTEQQYENAFDALEKRFSSAETVSLEDALKEVGKATGLKSVQDADALIQTAIRNGEIDAVAAPRYDVIDGNGKTIRTYLKRESAEAAAAKQGFSVRESTSINLQYAGKQAEIANAPTIREVTLKTGVEPEAFEIRSPDKVLASVKSEKEAAQKAERMAAVREGNAQRIEKQIQKEQAKIAGNQRRLEQMEAEGEGDSIKYKKLAAELDAKNKQNAEKIAKLEADAAAARTPLQVVPKGEKPTAKKGFTVESPVGETGALTAPRQDIGTFPTREAAEQAAIGNMPDDALQALYDSASKAKGVVPKRLANNARKELESRGVADTSALLRAPKPTGIPVSFTGTREQAEKTLAEAGVLTPQVREKMKELDAKLRPIMDKLGLKTMRLNIMRSIESEMGTADGYYFQKLIAISLDAPNPIRTLRHEGIHALKELGAFTPQQWKVLEDRARKEWVDKYKIAQRYQGLDQQSILEEAIADAFSDFDQTKPPAGLIGTLFRNIKQFMEALGNALNGMGFNTSESIFQQVEAGRMTPRDIESTGGMKFSQSYEDSADLTPLDVKKAKFYEKELNGLIKKVGARIAGMKSDETLDHVRQAVKKLQGYTAQGLKGKDWYENSADAVLKAFNGDTVLAEKFFQIIAITSANTEVAANFTKAYKAWNQFASGKPIKVGTQLENRSVDALLNFGEDWGGRKTNTFYSNLMEAMDGEDSGRSTIDLHMTRMLFDKDKPTNAQYELAENMVRLLASKLKVSPRQVQAASWVTQKSKSIFDYYRQRGWKKEFSDAELREYAMEKAIVDYSHLMKAKIGNLPVTEELQELSSNIRARVQNITGEVIPSVKTEMSQAEELDYKSKEKITKKIANEKTIDTIAKLLGIGSKVRVTVGSGAYESKVNPNLIVQVVNPDSEAALNDARDLANAMSYVFKQDATPFFRADPALVDSEQIGIRVKFKKELTPSQQKKILASIQERFGADAGFTRMRGNEIVAVNYRGEDGNPFMTSDEDFIDGFDEIATQLSEIAEIDSKDIFGAQSEYPYHDWQNDAKGTGIVERLYVSRPERPNLQGGLNNIRESFVGELRESIRAAGGVPRFSLRLDESTSGPSERGGIVLGRKQPGAVSVDAVHYGKEKTPVLNGNRYGSGINGAEAKRLAYSTDPRIRRRVYFYAPTEFGKMKAPEAGLGNYVYIQKFDNILAPSPEMSRLYRESGKDDNAFESAIIDAGYDGYYAPSMGMMVVLNHDVFVDYRGTRQEVAARPEAESIKIGDKRYSLRQTSTPEFKRWFGKSTIVDGKGKPKIMYHGTSRDIGIFEPKQAKAIFVTDDPSFAEQFAEISESYIAREMFGNLPEARQIELFDTAVDEAVQEEAIDRAKARELKEEARDEIENGNNLRNLILVNEILEPGVIDRVVKEEAMPARGNVMPLYVRAEKPFDYENPKHVKLITNGMTEKRLGRIERGSWNEIESADVQNLIKEAGFDSFYVKEGGRKNLAVYSPNQLKSAIGNIGAFSRSDNDIRYALALGAIEPQTPVVPDVGGNPDGILGYAPEALGGKPIRMLVGTHNDIEDKGYGANHILNRILKNPKREPEGSEEILEKVAKTAQNTAGQYFKIFKDSASGAYVFYNGRNALITSQRPNEFSVVSMFKQDMPEQKWGRPIWTGKAPSMPAAFTRPVRGRTVLAEEGRVIPVPVKSIAQKKRIAITPSMVSAAMEEAEAPQVKGTLGLKKMALREQITDGADAIAKMPEDVRDNTELGDFPGASFAYNLYEARKLLSKPSDNLKRITENNSFNLHYDTEYLANVDGEHYYVNLEEDPDDSDAQVYNFSPATDPLRTVDAFTFDKGELFNQIREDIRNQKGEGAKKLSLREQIDPNTVDAIDRTTTTRQEKGLAQRMAEAVSPTAFAKFRQGMINKYESIERLSGAVSKQYGDNELLADQSAIAAALFSDRAAGIAASSFRNGVPIYKSGFTTVSDLNGEVKGLIPILEPLMQYKDPFVFQAFQFYAATKRGKRLTAEGREKLFTADDIRRGAALERQFPEFKQVYDEYQKYNKGLVDYMKDTGVLSDQEADVWTQNWDYIPFYRQMDGEETVGPRVFSAISGVSKPKKLKGSEEALADFVETVVRNSRAAIEAGMKNVAAQRVARDIVRIGQGQQVPAALARGNDIMTVKENGKTVHYQVDDPLLVESVKSLNLPQLPFLDLLSMPTRALRELVTKDPGFMLANLMRDSLQAWTTTGVNMTPLVDTFKQFGQALTGTSPEVKALAQAGLFTGYDFAGDVRGTAESVEKELRRRAGVVSPKEMALWPITKVWEALDKGSTASDVATRAEVYKRTLEETGNEAEAMYQAMEVMNFSRKGNSALIRVLTALVPFMNARIQGLDVLYRAAFGKMPSRIRERQQKAFITRAMTITAMSMMYWMLASDEEEYQNAEQEVRDNYWIMGSVRIPIPFEIGTLFKVFPERILEYAFGDDTGKDLKDSIVRNLTSTLAVNPIPQAFLPALENLANYSIFTGQPIVGMGMRDVAAPYQSTPSTSLLAQELGQTLNYSPMKVDNLIRGYTGTIGTYVVMAIDSVMRNEGHPTKAAMGIEQTPVLKRFFASELGTGNISAYYDMKQKVEEATRTINFLERTGNIEDLQTYMQGKGAKMIALKPYVSALEKDMTMIRDTRRAIQSSKMEPSDKREVLDNLRKAEIALTSRVRYVQKMISQS